MRIAICFSGTFGKSLAEALHDWLPTVLDGAEPFFAPHDIRKGRKWFEALDSALRGSDAAVLCLTDDAPGPWLFWESGCSRQPYPLAFGFEPRRLLAGPLGQYQLTVFGLGEVREMVKALNVQAGGTNLDPRQVAGKVDESWPRLDARVGDLLARRPLSFEERIEGAWWERVGYLRGTRISYVRIQTIGDEARLRLHGDGYGKDGRTTAEWCSATAFPNPEELSLLYEWRGTAEVQREGIGKIQFSASDGPITGGNGSFSDDDGKGHYAKKRVVLVRATDAERAVMEGIDAAAKARLVRTKLREEVEPRPRPRARALSSSKRGAKWQTSERRRTSRPTRR